MLQLPCFGKFVEMIEVTKPSKKIYKQSFANKNKNLLFIRNYEEPLKECWQQTGWD